MRRFFAVSLPADGGEVVLGDGEQAHARVLRLAADAEVELFDGQGTIASARVLELKPLRVIASPSRQVHAPPSVTIGVGMPKGSKLDTIVRMCAEIGVSEVVPLVTERAVSAARGKQARSGLSSSKLGRLETIARQAARQSGRAHLLSVRGPTALDDFLNEREERTRLVAVVNGPEEPLRAELIAPAVLLIGPEGGLSNDEVERATAAGFIAFGLGPYALRVETAAPVIAGILMSRLNL